MNYFLIKILLQSIIKTCNKKAFETFLAWRPLLSNMGFSQIKIIIISPVWYEVQYDGELALKEYADHELLSIIPIKFERHQLSEWAEKEVLI